MVGAQLGTYQTVQTMTANEGNLVLLMFEGAERFVRRALRGLERGDIATFGYSLTRAQAMLDEMMIALAPDRGGEIAENLRRLYDFMQRQLTHGLVGKRAAPLEDVLGLLHTLRTGFEGAVGLGARD